MALQILREVGSWVRVAAAAADAVVDCILDMFFGCLLRSGRLMEIDEFI